MNAHKKVELIPSNSRENVLDFVLAEFDSKNNEIPELLSKFITLLGDEKEGWEGVRAIKECKEEFSIWKKGNPKLNGRVPTVDDFEEFLFSPDRNVIVIAIQGPDPSGTSKAVIPGAPGDPPPKLETLKGPGHRSSSNDPPPKLEKLKGPDNPSTSKKITQVAVGETSVPPADPKTLKLGIHGGEIQKTEVQEKTKTPCWGKEFLFPLSSLEGAKLVVEVYQPKNIISKIKFAGKFCILVSALKPGIQVIPLSSEEGNPCSSARLLVRIMLD